MQGVTIMQGKYKVQVKENKTLECFSNILKHQVLMAKQIFPAISMSKSGNLSSMIWFSLFIFHDQD